jgi:hypothetical protein
MAHYINRVTGCSSHKGGKVTRLGKTIASSLGRTMASVEMAYEGLDTITTDGIYEVLAISMGVYTPMKEDEMVFIFDGEGEDGRVLAIKTILGWQQIK